MLRRYCPPTSNSAFVICPSEHTRTVFISSANTLPFSITTCLQPRQRRRRLRRVARVEVGEALQLRLLLVLGRARELDLLRRAVGVRIAERVDADDRIGAVVLLVLVVQRLLLDLAALVAGLHRAQHAAALGDRLELLQHRLLDQVGQLVDDERALVRVLVLREPPFAVDDQLDRHRAAHALLGRRRDRLVVGVGVQRVGVVVGRDQRLQRRADVVERDLLRVQGAAGRLRVELELLRALVGAVAVPHRHRPDAARDAADHRVLGVHAVAEEERQVRREVVDVHAAREVRLDEREAVGQRERELRDRVRAGLGDVVAGDRHRVEVPDVVVDEVLPGCRPSP